MILPDIPRLYTALAEILGAVLYAQAAPSRTAKPVYWGITAGCGALLAAFLYLTGDVPLLWWIPCMAAAIVWIYLYLLATRELKMQIAAIRAERDKVKQDAALAEMEGDIHRYEAENKTGNPVLNTLLTAKSMYCQHQPDLRGRRHAAEFFDNWGDMHHRRHGAGQCHRECADRAGPRKAADSRGRLRPERLCDAAV